MMFAISWIVGLTSYVLILQPHPLDVVGRIPCVYSFGGIALLVKVLLILTNFGGRCGCLLCTSCGLVLLDL